MPTNDLPNEQQYEQQYDHRMEMLRDHMVPLACIATDPPSESATRKGKHILRYIRGKDGYNTACRGCSRHRAINAWPNTNMFGGHYDDQLAYYGKSLGRVLSVGWWNE